MKKTKTESLISPEELNLPDLNTAPASPPRKRAAKKAAAPAAATAAKEETATAAESAGPEKAPAKKTVAKKAAAKKAAKPAAEAPPEAPLLILQTETAKDSSEAPASAAAAVKPKVARKTAAKKASAPSMDTEAAAPAPLPEAAPRISPAPEPVPAPVLREEQPASPAVPAKKAARGTRTTKKTAAASTPSDSAEATTDFPSSASGSHVRPEAPAPAVSAADSSSNGSAASLSSPASATGETPASASPESAPREFPAFPEGDFRREGPPRRPDGPRDFRGEAPRPGQAPERDRERDRDRDFENRGPNGSGGPGAPGPEGDGRRLTKWERWKLRKEKFKLQKQQRYLDRQAGRIPPGPGGNGQGQGPQNPGDPGAASERRDPREFRDPREAREPREPRVWEPRAPRPEPVLGPPEDCAGLLELTDGKGFGFLRPRERGFAASPQDPFVSAEIVRQLGLRDGVQIEAVMRRGGRGPMVQEVKTVNGLEPNAYRTLPLFEELTAVNPNKRYILETEANRNTTRLIDFISPIGRGQRGLIVAPPRAGKTTFLQHIAEAMLQKYPDVKVVVLLVDERPEEVTELTRALPGAEIMASSNDQDPRNHIRMAHLAIERAKRLVEAGEHVFMLLDSITRLARGFNNAIRGGGGGKAMSGGLDSRALEAPRRLFAAARNTREAGSLTIMATALVETNNKGDDLIFQEFKGTGNMELVLDRKISQQYVYPAVDIFKSGTRREELLLPAHQLEKVHLIRRGLSGHRPVEAVERLLQVMSKYPNNNQMLLELKARE